MVALVDTCWANGVWADTVWASGVWASSATPTIRGHRIRRVHKPRYKRVEIAGKVYEGTEAEIQEAYESLRKDEKAKEQPAPISGLLDKPIPPPVTPAAIEPTPLPAPRRRVALVKDDKERQRLEAEALSRAMAKRAAREAEIIAEANDEADLLALLEQEHGELQKLLALVGRALPGRIPEGDDYV